jgi:hypothetical protein
MVGSFILMRADKKPLNVAHALAVVSYCGEIRQCRGPKEDPETMTNTPGNVAYMELVIKEKGKHLMKEASEGV